MAGKKFEEGHFKEHNKQVVDRIRSKKTLKDGFKEYVKSAGTAGIALVDAGASPEQMKSSLQALLDNDNINTAWEAITDNTGHK